jgi:hypothetical protein
VKWLFASVSVLVAGAVASLAIYAFAIRDDDDGLAKARGVADAICAGYATDCARVDHLRHLGGEWWKFGAGNGDCIVFNVRNAGLTPVQGFHAATC